MHDQGFWFPFSGKMNLQYLVILRKFVLLAAGSQIRNVRDYTPKIKKLR